MNTLKRSLNFLKVDVEVGSPTTFSLFKFSI